MSVTALRQKLTLQDIERLSCSETPEERAIATRKICKRIDLEHLDEDQRQIANEILTILAADTATLVRRTLAVTLGNSPNLPRETALRLARDIEGVSAPVLLGSFALTDADLIELIELGSMDKQISIAERRHLSVEVTESMAHHGTARAIRAMVNNEGAELSERAYGITLQRFGDNEGIKGAIIGRERIPMGIAEKLVSMVTGDLFDRLVNRHALPPRLAIEIAESTRERATIDLIEQAGCSSDPAGFARHLKKHGRLSHRLLMRAMCLGHLKFVEHGFSVLSGLSYKRVWMLLHDSGSLGLKTLLRCTGLPQHMGRVFQLALKVFHETELDPDMHGRERFRRRLIERILTCDPGGPREDMKYLLEKLDALGEIEDSGYRLAS